MALNVFNSSSKVGFASAVAPLRLLLFLSVLLLLSFLFSARRVAVWFFLMLAILASAPGDIEQDEEFDPGETTYFTVRLHWCPFSLAKETVHVLIKLLPLCKPMVPFVRWDEVDRLIFNIHLTFVPYDRIGFDPF